MVLYTKRENADTMRLNTIVNIGIIALVMFSVFYFHEETCDKNIVMSGYDDHLFYDLQGDKCCGFIVEDNRIVKECP